MVYPNLPVMGPGCQADICKCVTIVYQLVQVMGQTLPI